MEAFPDFYEDEMNITMFFTGEENTLASSLG